MIRIRQHGPEGELYDFNTFLSDIPRLRNITHWRVRIEWCLGNRAGGIEHLCSTEFVDLSSRELAEMYREIYQTVDGEFIGQLEGKQFCHPAAVDSSWWEISGPDELEQEMLGRYGAYQRFV